MFKKITVIIYLFFLLLVSIWIVQIKRGEIPYIDTWTRAFVKAFTDTSTYEFFSWMTQFGGRTFLIPFTITMAILLFFMYKKVIPPLIFGLGTYGAHLLNQLIKIVIERERPSISMALHAEGYSFPSGHAMNAIVCYGILAYFLTTKIRSSRGKLFVWIVTALFIFIIGISRYVINVHYLTDVIAGYFFGSLYVIGILYLYHKSVHRETKF